MSSSLLLQFLILIVNPGGVQCGVRWGSKRELGGGRCIPLDDIIYHVLCHGINSSGLPKISELR